MHARLCWGTGVHIRDTQMEAREKKRDQENLPSTAKPTPKGPKAQSKAKSSLNQLQRNRSQVSWLPAPSVAGPPPPHWFFIGERRRDPHLYLGEAERTALRLAPPPKSFQGLVLAGTVSLWSRGRILPVQPTGGPPVYRACLRLLIRSHAVH